MLNSGRSRDKMLQCCLREICFLAAQGEFEVRAVHIAGVDNRLPDLLSRWNKAACRHEFFRLTAHKSMVPVEVDPLLFEFSHRW